MHANQYMSKQLNPGSFSLPEYEAAENDSFFVWQITSDIESIFNLVSGAPPSYTDLFPMQEIRSQVDQAREEGRQATVPLTVCEILCKSCEL